jgi:hypothetical protein
MKRRDFLKYSAIGSGSLITTVAFQPQPAEAFFFLGLLLRAAGMALKSGLQVRSQKWWDDRYEAMLAQSRLFDAEFRRVEVAELNNRFYNYVAVGQQNIDVAMSLPRILPNGSTSVSTFASPAAAGVAIAATYLRENERLYPEQVQNAILPTYKNQDNISSWNQSFSSSQYESVNSTGGVAINYRLRQPGRGGYGELDIIVDADRTIRVPTTRVNFSTYG